jgi:hypothetical protein
MYQRYERTSLRRRPGLELARRSHSDRILAACGKRPIALVLGHPCSESMLFRRIRRTELPIRRVAKSLSVLDLLPAVSDQLRADRASYRNVCRPRP